MKKIIVLILIIIGLVLITEKSDNQEEIRIRILANSNELNDQIEKITIKEKVMQILNQESKIKEVLENNLSKFTNTLKDNLDETLFTKLKIEYRNVNFPAKTINGKIIKAGNYKTLLITIEDGKGKNWWSILYPEFYGVEYDDNNEIEYKLYIKEVFNK